MNKIYKMKWVKFVEKLEQNWSESMNVVVNNE